MGLPKHVQLTESAREITKLGQTFVGPEGIFTCVGRFAGSVEHDFYFVPNRKMCTLNHFTIPESMWKRLGGTDFIGNDILVRIDRNGNLLFDMDDTETFGIVPFNAIDEF
jgi:hypothetical protein